MELQSVIIMSLINAVIAYVCFEGNFPFFGWMNLVCSSYNAAKAASILI